MRGILLPMGLLACFLMVGCRSEGESALAEGNTLLNSTDPADWERAAEAFERSIETEVKARSQLVRAWSKVGVRKMNEADKMTVKREDEMQIHLIGGTAKRIGMMAAEYELYTAAISNLQLAARALPNDKMTWYYLGLSWGQISRGQPDGPRATEYLEKSDDAFKRAIKLDADFRNALYGRGIVLIIKKDTDEAERVLQHLVSLEPKEARGYFALGRVYYDRKEYQKAENVYHLLREMIPEKSPKRGLIEENLRKLEIMPKVRP
ncbi:MAG TPA: tetratricopeptide repeat protein [Spirochaetota bacterium]|nr:tetratricopeptide repeat protein [Spirochaetota bacterium]